MEYLHKHYTEMHRACYDAGTPCEPTTYGDEVERWEMLGTGDESITAGWSHDDGRDTCARCDVTISTGQAIVTYVYYWND